MSSHAVALVDALGTSEVLQDPERAQAVLETVYDVTTNAVPKLLIGAKLDGIKSQFFSDSLCLAVSGEHAAVLQRLALSVAGIQATFALRGRFLRGALALGLHHHSEYVVFGPALLRAYLLERDCAVYPRVVFDGHATEVAYGSVGRDDEVIPLARDVTDDSVFVDFLQLVDKTRLRAVRDQIARACAEEKLRAQLSRRRRAWEKLRWLADYYNWRVNTRSPIEAATGKREFEEVTSFARWCCREDRG